MKIIEQRYIHVPLNRLAVHVPEDENTIILSNPQVSITNKIINTKTYKQKYWIRTTQTRVLTSRWRSPTEGLHDEWVLERLSQLQTLAELQSHTQWMKQVVDVNKYK